MEMMNTTKISGVVAVADVVYYPESTCWSLVLANYEVACVGDSWAEAERDTGQTTINIMSGGGLYTNITTIYFFSFLDRMNVWRLYFLAL